jgi:MoaA/NifB/PqqE/SkfB family radical SAM enzyme
MLDQLQGFHIEPTNMCTLKCPQCARTEFIKQFPNKWKNYNLDLAALKKFLNIDLSKKTINICGNYGDPIYYPNLFDMVEYFKQQGSIISISTNGSYRSKDWWTNLGKLLDDKDQIVFGIDGMPDNFTNYRINADWNSIKIGIDILKQTSVKTKWQFIPFSYNEFQIEEAQTLSQELGFTEFFILDSNRWDREYNEYTPNIIENINISKKQWKTDRNINVDPQCKKANTHHYISADGYYMPCSYVGDYRFYYKSEFFKNKETYNINTTTIGEILQNNNTINFYNSIEDAKLSYCTFNCPKL